MKKIALLFLQFTFLFALAQAQSPQWVTITQTQYSAFDNNVRSIASDNQGNAWIGTRYKGILKWDGTQITVFSKNNQLPNSGSNKAEITALAIIDNKMYIGVKASASQGGLWIYDFATDVLTYIGNLEFIGAMDIKYFYKSDPNQPNGGQIYCGSGNGFYKRIADNNWQKLKNGWCQSIAEKNGVIYFTTYDSLYKYNQTTNKITSIYDGMFYSVGFDGTGIGYASSSNKIYKIENDNLTVVYNNVYSKAMSTDKNGRLWIVSSTTNSFGVYGILGNDVITYNTGNSPLLSTDMTCVHVDKNNKKYFGHYSAGMNILIDAPVYEKIQLTPNLVSIKLGESANFAASKGQTPYSWTLIPDSLGQLNITGTNNQNCQFLAKKVGSGKLYVISANNLDTAFADIVVKDSAQQFPIIPPGFLRASKGAHPEKIFVTWQAPGEFYEGFEYGFPPEWKEVKNDTLPKLWKISQFLPAEGKYSIKFDVYFPGTPVASYLISPKIFVPHDKTTLRMKIKTAYALFNSYDSQILVSTTTDDISSFTPIKTLDAAYLKTVSSWTILDVDLSAYADQYIYFAIKGYAEDLIIYFDDMKLVGVSGLNYIAKNVKKYRLDITLDESVMPYVDLDTTYYEMNFGDLIRVYYQVKAIYKNDSISDFSNWDFGIAYSQSDSIVIDSVSSIVPVVDGKVEYEEYKDAVKIPLTRFGYWANAYLKIANNKLYIGAIYSHDNTEDAYDFMLFAFDRNRNKQYENDVEGYYRILRLPNGETEKSFFPWTDYGFIQGYLNPVGMEGKIGTLPESTNINFEMSIDLTNSNLQNNGIIGAYLLLFNAANEQNPAWLESANSEYSVLKFGSITFKPLIVNVEKPQMPPAFYSLEQNYPNPFNPSTTIKYSLPEESFVTLKVYDALGRTIKTLVNQKQRAGYYELKFDASNLSNGIYFYEIKANNFRSIKKMILTK